MVLDICHVAILEVLSECLPLFDVFCKRSLNFINRCLTLVSYNVVVSFVARHGVFHSRMFSCIGRNFQFCCNRYRLRACDLVNRAHYEHVIDKASTDRLDHSVQCCADLIRELVMVIHRNSKVYVHIGWSLCSSSAEKIWDELVT